MNRSGWIFFSVFIVSAVWVAGEAMAQSSLGIGRNEQQLPTGGLFAGFFDWVRIQQAAFHQSIREILLSMRNEGSHFWALIWICFLYGVFHAIGPGHGKVVISSYMVANEVAVRRGIAISMAASVLQGLTAVVAISFFVIALRGSGIKTGDMAYGLEVASYVGVMVVGLWLLWRKLFRKSHSHSHDHGHDHHHHDHDHGHNHHDHEHVGHGEVCDHCGHSHIPEPETLTGKFGIREAWTAILAVGLRPCTGALIVLVFCFANGLYLAGIASTFAMSIGTGIAVSGLAMLAVTAKNAALKISGAQASIGWINRIIEIAAAAFIFLIGLVLFVAAINA
ncbi:MAG: nickel/cobalt transporter [Rhizobiaceae bacterium]|nr:nickel/cobalt transporter [Rhizobiaceae bacterium]